MLREHDGAGDIEELMAAVQATFEEALSAAAGDTPSGDALRACESLLDRLSHGLDEAFAMDRRDVAVFMVGQYRLRFAKILEQLCGLELSVDDQLAIVSVVQVFSTFTNTVVCKWPGTVLPLPLHEVGAVTPLMDRFSPFCEGHLLFRAPGGASSWQRYWAVLDRGQLALYSSRVKADDDPGTCCLRMSLSAVVSVQTDDTSRMLTLSLIRVAETAHSACCSGLTVTEQLFSSMDFRVDMAPDYKAWSCALSTSQEAAALWSQFSTAQPQWSQLAKARSPRWTSPLGGTEESDIAARMASAASEAIGLCLPSEHWWSILDSVAAVNGSLSAALGEALQGMLCLLSNALWTRLAASAPWYWNCELEKAELPVEQCDGMVATDALALAHCELLRQLAAAVRQVTSADMYQQRADEQARLGAWSLKMQCEAGRWCGGLSETLQPLRQPACWPTLLGPGALIYRNQLPSPSLPIHNGLDDAPSWCGVDQWCVVQYASPPSVPIPGDGTEMGEAGAVALRCISCLPSKLECCAGGGRSGRMADLCMPDGRCAIVFHGDSADVPAVLWLADAELAEKWKSVIHGMQTSTVVLPSDEGDQDDTVVLPGDEGGQDDTVQDLVEATQMVEELCIDLFEMYAADLTSLQEQEQETNDRYHSQGSPEPPPKPDLRIPSDQDSPPPIAAVGDSRVPSRRCTPERAAEVQRAIQGMFEGICVSHIPHFGASAADATLEDDVADQLQEKAAQSLVRWAEWYSLRMECVASSLAVAMNLGWGAKLRAAGPRLQATPAFSAAIDASCSAAMRRLQASVGSALKHARTASDNTVLMVDDRCTHIFWQELVIAALREFEAVCAIGCVRLLYNLARGIVGLFVETAEACTASESRSTSASIDWVCTVANTGVLAFPLVSRLLARLENAIPDPYRTQLDTNCVKVALSNMVRDGVEWLAAAVVQDVQTILCTSSSRWSAQDEDEGMDMTMAAVVATVADYFDDFGVLLVQQHLEIVAEGVATGFAHAYLECLLRNPHSGRHVADDDADAVAAQAAQAVEGDLLLVMSVLSTHLPAPRLDTALQPLRSVAALLVAPIVPAEQFAVEFDRLCRRHWGSNGISFALAERILDLRGVADGVLSRAKTNARTACEQRLAAHWGAVQLVVAPVQPSTRRTQETSRRRRINWQERGCDTFCHSCAGSASSTSATHQLLMHQCRTPTVFDLLEGELGLAEISTLAELELFREETALATTVHALESAHAEIRVLEQKKEECVAARDMYRAELSDLTAELEAVAAASAMPAQGVAKPAQPGLQGYVGRATDAPGAEASEIAGDDI